MSRRIRIKSLQGGLNPQRKAVLCQKLYDNGIKFSRLTEANEAFICVCLEDDDVDRTISTKLMKDLRSKNFEVIVPPPLRAKKSIIIRRLDHEITTYDNDDIIKNIL